MADHPELHGVIRLEDHGSEALRQVAQEIHKVSAQAAHAGHAVEHMHHESVLAALRERTGEIREGFDRAGESVLRVHENIADLLPAFAALGAAGSIAGIFELVEHEAEQIETLTHAAKVIGTTAEQLQALHYAARLTGTSTETLDKSLERLNKNIGAAAHGTNKAVAAVLAHAHVQLYANGHLRDASEIMPQLAHAFQHTKSVADQSRIAFLLFGRAGQELLPFLTEGAEKVNEASAEFRHLHPASEEGRRALLEYADAMKQTEEAGAGFKEAMAGALAPLLLPLQHEAAEFLAHQAELATKHQGIGGFLEREGAQVKAFLEGVNWEQVGADIEHLAESVDGVVHAFGGWKIAGEALAAMMLAKGALFLGGPIIEVGKLAFAIGGLSLKLTGLATKWMEVGTAAGEAAAHENAAAAAGARAGSGGGLSVPAGEDGLRTRAQHAIDADNRRHRLNAGVFALAANTFGAVLGTSDGYEVTQDDVYRDPALLKRMRGQEFDWAKFGKMPQHSAGDQFFYDHFGENFGANGLRGFLPSVPDWLHRYTAGPSSTDEHGDSGGRSGGGDYFSARGGDTSNPFANPGFATEHRVEGEFTLHLDAPNLPPGTTATLTPNPPTQDNVRLNVGSYDGRH